MKTLPNTFIIGGPKCGTTSLTAYLATHPHVCTSRHDEPHYFSDQAHLPYFEFKSVNDYLDLFSHAKESDRVLVDSSTSYIWSAEAAPKILDFNPQAKLIAIVRDPVDLVVSLHWQELYGLYEDRVSLEEAWDLQEERRNGKNLPSTCTYPAAVQYQLRASLGTHLKRIIEQVPSDQLLIIDFKDFSEKTREVYTRVLSFLNLEDDGRKDFPVANASKSLKYRWIHKLLKHPPLASYWMPVARIVSRRIGLKNVRGNLMERFRKEGQKPVVEDAVLEKITEAMKEEREILKSILSSVSV